eukprot:scaffold4093_cov49-Phaeocystis_antarctica.AAC.1
MATTLKDKAHLRVSVLAEKVGLVHHQAVAAGEVGAVVLRALPHARVELELVAAAVTEGLPLRQRVERRLLGVARLCIDAVVVGARGEVDGLAHHVDPADVRRRVGPELAVVHVDGALRQRANLAPEPADVGQELLVVVHLEVVALGQAVEELLHGGRAGLGHTVVHEAGELRALHQHVAHP